MPRSGWLAVGAVASAWAGSTLGWVAAAAIVSMAMAAALLLRAGRIPTARPVGVVTLGAVLLLLRALALPATQPVATTTLAERGPWTFVVESVGAAREGRQTATLRSLAGETRVAATLPPFPAVAPGDRVTADGRIRARPDSSYGLYLERIGAVGTLTAGSMTVERAPPGPATVVEAVRQATADALSAALPEPEAGLAAGILIGLRDRVDRDLAAAFTTAGVSHVVAISGWNIAIVAAAMAAVFGRMHRRRRSILTMAAIVAYVIFAGASASVVRAGVMAGVVLLARESGRAGRAAAALGWAATLLLLAEPTLIDDAGFQLSALATAGLIAWATPISTWLSRVGRGHLPGWLTESLGVSLAAQVATMPVVLVAFGRLAILAPVVNLAVVPLVAPAMAAGLLAMVGGAITLAGAPGVIGAVLAMPGWVTLRIIIAIVDATASLPFASVTLPAPVAAGVALGTIALMGGIHVLGRYRAAAIRPMERPASRTSSGTVRSRSATMAVMLLAGSIIVAGAVVVSRPAGVARVTVLDVGQGDAILVEGSRGGRLLIDGGPDPARLLVALDGRIPPWDRRIDAVILSHPHEDHVAGLARLLARYQITRVFEPGMRGPGPGYAEWLRRLAATGAPIRLGLAAGDALTVDEIRLEVLWPVRGQVPAEAPDGGTGINNVSIVLLGAVADHRMLLAGDVEEAIDASLLAEELPRLDLLKVAHHGSRTATTQAFVDAVRPRIAIASAGAGNPYGHPARATLDRLAASGARVFRTDLDGSVAVTFTPAGLDVRASGGRATAEPTLARPAAALGAVFRCAIPIAALVPEREATPTARAPLAVRPGGSPSVGYHRSDDDPMPGGGLPPAIPRPPDPVPTARVRRR